MSPIEACEVTRDFPGCPSVPFPRSCLQTSPLHRNPGNFCVPVTLAVSVLFVLGGGGRELTVYLNILFSNTALEGSHFLTVEMIL